MFPSRLATTCRKAAKPTPRPAVWLTPSRVLRPSAKRASMRSSRVSPRRRSRCPPSAGRAGQPASRAREKRRPRSAQMPASFEKDTEIRSGEARSVRRRAAGSRGGDSVVNVLLTTTGRFPLAHCPGFFAGGPQVAAQHFLALSPVVSTAPARTSPFPRSNTNTRRVHGPVFCGLVVADQRREQQAYLQPRSSSLEARGRHRPALALAVGALRSALTGGQRRVLRRSRGGSARGDLATHAADRLVV